MKGTNQSYVKKLNKRAIIQHVLQQGSMSRADLANELNMSKPAVSSNVKELIEEKILIEAGTSETGLGKKGTLLDINVDYRYLVIVDLSDGLIKVGVGNFKGDILFTEIMPSPLIKQGEYIAQHMQEYISEHIKNYMYECLKKYSIEIKKIGAVIVGAPGIIGEYEEKRAMDEYITGLKNISIKRIYEDIFDVPVTVINDINLGAIGQQHFGGHETVSNMMYVWLLQGIGAGIILNGELYKGTRAAAGELGFIKINQETTQKTLLDIVSVMLMENCLNENKGKISTEAFRDLGNIIGHAIGNMAVFLDLELIVLDGMLVRESAIFVEEVNKSIEETVINPIKISVSTLEHSVIYGGLKLGMNILMENLMLD